MLDVAHNPEAFERLFNQTAAHFPGKKIHLLLGMSHEKEIEECAKMIQKKVTHLHLMKMSHSQLMSNLELERVFHALEFYHITHHTSLREVIKFAKEDQAILLIAGSFYLLSEILSKSPNISSISSIEG